VVTDGSQKGKLTKEEWIDIYSIFHSIRVFSHISLGFGIGGVVMRESNDNETSRFYDDNLCQHFPSALDIDIVTIRTLYTLISSYDRNGQLAYQAAVETTSTFYERM
jgi:hypothetical protein